MRQFWFDRLDKMITKVRRSAQPFWASQHIQRLFKVRTESARNLAIAIGRFKIDARSYAIESTALLAFLNEFHALLDPAGRLKGPRSEAIRAAQAMFQKKLEEGRRDPKEAAPSRPTHDVLPLDPNFEIQAALLPGVFQVQASSGETRQDAVAEICNSRKQENATTKPIRPRTRKRTQVSEHSQSFLDFVEGGGQTATEKPKDLPEQQ